MSSLPLTEWERAADSAANRYLAKITWYADHADLRQIALIAAWEAAQRYDESRGPLFEWAYGRALGAMQDALRGRQYGAQFTRVDLRELAKLERGEEANPPTIRELCSLDKAIGVESDATLYELTGSGEDVAGETVDRDAIYALIYRLPKRWAAILCLHYVDGYAQDEIAEAIGVDPSRISQIISRASWRLHGWMVAEGLIEPERADQPAAA